MAKDRHFDETISEWFEEAAPPRVPSRVLDATFERTRGTKQRTGWHALPAGTHVNRIVSAFGAVAAVAVISFVALGLYFNHPGVGAPGSPLASGPAATEAQSSDGEPDALAGSWESYSDADGGHQVMELTKLADGTYDVIVRDDFASVCDGASSTMTGVAEVMEPGTIVIAQPDYVCDDGSEAQALSGPPLAEQLQNLGFTYDPVSDELEDSFGGVWTRMGPRGPEASPAATAASGAQASVFAGNWEATDGPPDSSHLTMELTELADGTYDVSIRDDFASVCDGASSTMTGVAEPQGPRTIVMAQPDYVCDDGSEAQALSGPPLDEQLQNLGFTYDPVSDELEDSFGLTWSRVAPTPGPTGSNTTEPF